MTYGSASSSRSQNWRELDPSGRDPAHLRIWKFTKGTPKIKNLPSGPTRIFVTDATETTIFDI